MSFKTITIRNFIFFLALFTFLVPSQGRVCNAQENKSEQNIPAIDNQALIPYLKGLITDRQGETIIGASIRVKGKDLWAITDAEGKFVIKNVPENGTLVISYIGYQTQEIQIDRRSEIRVELQENTEELDEVIVVAYGTAKKTTFTGSAEAVKQDRFGKRMAADVSKALEGTVSGVQSTSGSGQPGTGAAMVIRGFGSISAANAPLYVVDGIPYDGVLNTINPNDIETVTVLKDASAATLYGARGANGVVMITTKRGGKNENQITIDLKANWGIASKALPEYRTVNEREYLELAFEAYKNEKIYTEGVDPGLAPELALSEMGNIEKGLLGFKEEYNPFNMPLKSLIDPITGSVNPAAELIYDENWRQELSSENPLRQEYILSVSGGDKAIKYLLSLGYLDEKGLLKTTAFERYSGRLNLDIQARKWLNMGMNASFSQTTSNYKSASDTQVSNLWYASQIMAPIYPVYEHNLDGSLKLDPSGNRIFDYGQNRPALSNSNAIAWLHQDKELNSRDNFSGRTYAEFNVDEIPELSLLKGLKFSVNFGLDYFNTNEMSYSNPYTGNAANTSGSLSKATQRQLSYTFNQLLTYKKDIEDHAIDVLIGHEYYQLTKLFQGAIKTGFPFGGLYELSTAGNLAGAASQKDRYAIESYLGRINYDFKRRYYLSGSFRRDGSSRFFKKSRWGEFWSLGASWRISEENFMAPSSDWINNLTLKISYGSQGNDNIGGYYAYQSLYNMNLPNGPFNGASINTLENIDLSWEKNQSLNTGFEARIFDRLSITTEFYTRHTTDLLLSMPKATSTGFDAYPANVGSMMNVGLDVTLNADVLRRKNFRWTAILIGSHVRNRILKLAEKPEIINGPVIFREGETVNSFYLPLSAGVDPLTGNQLYWVDRDEKNQPVPAYKTDNVSLTESSRKIVGNRIPDLHGSFTNEFYYKGFDLSVQTTFSLGGKMLDGVYGGMMNVTRKGYTWHQNALRRWRKPGDQTDIPKVMWNQQVRVTDKDLLDASYFAVKNITLGYNLPAKYLRHSFVNHIRLYASANNLVLFTHLKGMDPQYNFTGTVGYTYTPSKTISFGIDMKL